MGDREQKSLGKGCNDGGRRFAGKEGEYSASDGGDEEYSNRINEEGRREQHSGGV